MPDIDQTSRRASAPAKPTAVHSTSIKEEFRAIKREDQSGTPIHYDSLTVLNFNEAYPVPGSFIDSPPDSAAPNPAPAAMQAAQAPTAFQISPRVLYAIRDAFVEMWLDYFTLLLFASFSVIAFEFSVRLGRLFVVQHGVVASLWGNFVCAVVWAVADIGSFTMSFMVTGAPGTFVQRLQAHVERRGALGAFLQRLREHVERQQA